MRKILCRIYLNSGKAVSRTLRAHQLVDLALNTVLLEAKADENGDISLPDTEKLANLYDDLVSNQITADDVCSQPILSDLADSTQSKKILETSRTAKLWLQYMHLNDLLKKFIRAERTGNWQLHLKTLESMLPYLAASGHNLYTKSVWIYLERMSNLEEEHPDIHESFIRGMHVVRRSERFWAGLSTDLIIEQVLMRSLKTSGGLTRGTGFKEMQRNTWLFSRSICSAVSK